MMDHRVLLAACLACAGTLWGGARFDSEHNTIVLLGPGNTLRSIAQDLMFPDCFCYDFAARTVVSTADIAIGRGGELVIGAEDLPSRGETLHFSGAHRVLTVGGTCLHVHHSTISGAAIRYSNGHATIRDSRIVQSGIQVSGRAAHGLRIINTRFERCRTPLSMVGTPSPVLSGLTFRSCSALSLQRDTVLRDGVFEDSPVQYSNVGAWKGGEGTTVTLINCTPWTEFPGGGSKLFLRGSRALRQWYLRVQVVDRDRNALGGATVTVKDRAGRLEHEAVTDDAGYAVGSGSRDLPVTEFVHDADGVHPAGPHRVEARAGDRLGAVSADISRASKDRPLKLVIRMP